MRTISLCAIAAAMVAIGLVVWTASTPVVPSVGQGVDPAQIMTAITGLLPEEFVDYTFVFV